MRSVKSFYLWCAIMAAGIVFVILGTVVSCKGPESESLGVATQAITCVTFQRGTLGTVADATIQSKTGSCSTYADGSNPTLDTGKTTCSTSAALGAHTLVRFDLSSIPSGATINSATATINVNAAHGSTIKVHNVTSSWAESTVTWSNFTAGYNTTANTTFTFPNNNYANKTFDATSLVTAWVGGTPNYGFLLEEDGSNNVTGYRSSEDGTVTSRPSLQVCYTVSGTTSSTASGSGGTTASSTAATTAATTAASTTAATTGVTTAASTTSATTSATTAASTSSTAASTSSTGAGAGGGSSTFTIGYIGDWGAEGGGIDTVMTMVKSWNPDAIVSGGDNVYDSAAGSYDAIAGKRVHEYMDPYSGAWGAGSTTGNRFWSTVGNHDWDFSLSTSGQNYFTFFNLPGPGTGNHRYYAQQLDTGNLVRLYAIDSDLREPDGNSPGSTQATWLQGDMTSSTSCLKFVAFHEPAYSSCNGQCASTNMRWAFQTWGADLIMQSHLHIYERLSVSGLTYLVNGAGGGGLWGPITNTDPNSVYQYPTSATAWGAVKIVITKTGSAVTIDGGFYGAGATTPSDTWSIFKTCN